MPCRAPAGAPPVETIKGAISEVLDGIDALRREHDQELRQVRHYYHRRLVAPAGTERTPVHGARVARLLALAVSTNSEREGAAALGKAPALHRLAS
jgi:hypothetical protein